LLDRVEDIRGEGLATFRREGLLQEEYYEQNAPADTRATVLSQQPLRFATHAPGGYAAGVHAHSVRAQQPTGVLYCLLWLTRSHW
jgi:hypothetical protein